MLLSSHVCDSQSWIFSLDNKCNYSKHSNSFNRKDWKHSMISTSFKVRWYTGSTCTMVHTICCAIPVWTGTNCSWKNSFGNSSSSPAAFSPGDYGSIPPPSDATHTLWLLCLFGALLGLPKTSIKLGIITLWLIDLLQKNRPAKLKG